MTFGAPPTPTNAAHPPDLEARIEAQAYALGFDLVGFASLGPVDTAVAFDQWIERGFAGEMHYLERGAAKRHDTRLPYEGASSAIVVAMNYGGTEPTGPIARYARGDDYHHVMEEKLRQLHEWIRAQLPFAVDGKAYVDTGPILERDLARRAGLGWFGKNTNLINPRLGSFFFIGALLVRLDLVPSPPFATDHCGTCRRCLDACPTQAFEEAGVLDATRCISYLSIEQRGEIPEALRPLVGELLYGCDICQDVCPWNEKFSRDLRVEAFAPRQIFVDAGSREGTRALARAILKLEPTDYATVFRGSAIKRAKLWMLKRNACVVLGNVGTTEDFAALDAMQSHEHEIVRDHAAWAVEQVAGRDGAHSGGSAAEGQAYL